jgi:glucose-6-phosphate 1-dehydrogenase
MLARLLPAELAIVAFGRRPLSDRDFRDQMKDSVAKFSRTPLREEIWVSFAESIYYVRGEPNPDGMAALKEKLAELDRTRGTAGNRLYYLATPPSLFAPIVAQLGAAGLNAAGQAGAWARVIIEKPFGHDLASALALNAAVRAVFGEDQIYRIDHYLGKETVQNIFAFRFANRLWEPVWSDQHIDNVQITVAETVGVEDRGEYYEESGAIRDMVQNHMLQLLSMVAMEPPVAFEAETIRDEKMKVLRAIRPMTPAQVAANSVRGQYAPGFVGGKEVAGYREEPEVAPDSQVETYVALRLFLDNWRWAGTPFYLRHGKRLPKRVTEIAIQFKRPPHLAFAATDVERLEPNILVVRIQPDEGISLRFGAKVPGPAMQIRSVNMDFLYGSSFLVQSPEAYERLILDCMFGDHTLFNRDDSVEHSWEIVDAIRRGWAEAAVPLHPYAAGTWGPAEADRLMDGGAAEDRRWRRP